VYFGSEDGKLYAIEENGLLRWMFTTGDAVRSSPAIAIDGTVYVGSNDYNLYAINPDGTQKWAFTTGSHVISSPAIAEDGTIHVGSYDYRLYAINPDGTQKWGFPTNDSVFSSPAIATDGTVYVGSDDYRFYGIEGDSGCLANTFWPMFHHDLGHTGRVGSVNITPIADAGDHYVGMALSPMTFDGTGSYDPDGSIVSYDWDFGDGNTGTGPTPTHIYANSGTYIVILTVTDDDDATDTDDAVAYVAAAHIICPVSAMCADSVVHEELRQFRDNMLAGSDTGQKLIHAYYQHSPEVTDILFENPKLLARSAAILMDVMPGIRFLLGDRRGRDIAMTSVRVARIKRLFRDISREGSDELERTLSTLVGWLEEYRGMRVSQIWRDMDR
jgi:PKD repeat protein